MTDVERAVRFPSLPSPTRISKRPRAASVPFSTDSLPSAIARPRTSAGPPRTVPGSSRLKHSKSAGTDYKKYLETLQAREWIVPNNPKEWDSGPSIAWDELEEEQGDGFEEQSRRKKEEVDVEIFFKVVKEKEQLHKQISDIQSLWDAKQKELQIAQTLNEELDRKVKETEIFVEKARVELREHEQKKERVNALLQQVEDQDFLRDQIIRNTRSVEEMLDATTAAIGTKSLIKQIIEKKLERSSEEKVERAKLKNTLLEESVADKQSHTQRIEALLKQRQSQKELLLSLDSKLKAVKTENLTLEAQLEKAKIQVNQLIQQIVKYEAKAAREHKAEKKAKEAQLSSKSKYPTGIVTVAFSDVQCSTYQWEQFPEAMSQAMEIHNSVLRENLKITGGYEVKTEGDSFMVAFLSAVSAIWWCLFSQEALLQANWPPALLKSPYAQEERDQDGKLLYRGLRVRMGVHMGKPECKLDQVTNRMDYFGGMVNRAARIEAIACGGQILLSNKVWEAARMELNAGDVAVEHLGEHYLKNLKSGEHIVQILPKSLAGVTIPFFILLFAEFRRQRKFPQLVTTKETPLGAQENMKFHEYEQSEEVAESQVSLLSSIDTQKLTTIVNEIDATLKARHDKEQSKLMGKEIKSTKQQIKQCQDQLSAINAEKELLTYQIEKLKKKNLLYSQDVAQAAADKDVAAELMESFQKEKKVADSSVVNSNAKTFCLLIRQNLLEGTLGRLNQEIELYQRQLNEQQGTYEEMKQLTERIQLAESQLKQVKQETEFYVKQIQDVEVKIRETERRKHFNHTSTSTTTNTRTDSSSSSSSSLSSSSSSLTGATIPKSPSSTSLDLQTKAKYLEEQMEEETSQCQTVQLKVSSLQSSINALEDELRPVLLKKVKLLEEELLTVKGEKEILIKQLDLSEKYWNEDKAQQTRLLNDASGKMQTLKQKNLFFVKRLARSRLARGQSSASLEDHMESIQKFVETSTKGGGSSHSETSPSSTKTQEVNAKWLDTLSDNNPNQRPEDKFRETVNKLTSTSKDDLPLQIVGYQKPTNQDLNSYVHISQPLEKSDSASDASFAASIGLELEELEREDKDTGVFKRKSVPLTVVTSQSMDFFPTVSGSTSSISLALSPRNGTKAPSPRSSSSSAPPQTSSSLLVPSTSSTSVSPRRRSPRPSAEGETR